MANALGDDLEPGDRARRRLEQETRLRAPELIDLEVLAALRRRVAAGQMNASRAHEAVDRLGRLRLTRYRHSSLLRRAWELRDNVTPYDAAYVALAELLGCPLITADARLARASGPRCPIEILRV